MYVLIQSDEDGSPLMFLDSLEEVLDNPEDYGIEEFKDSAFLKKNQDPNYWPDGIAVLAKLEVLTPKSITSKWGLE